MKGNGSNTRLALPSKGRLLEPSLQLLSNAGLEVHKPNPRQYQATIPNLPGVGVLFQRPGDIVVSVRDGSVDFGITGWDVVAEHRGEDGEVFTIHPSLGFGHCSLNVIVPETWEDTNEMADLVKLRSKIGRPLRAATKFPNLTRTFFEAHNLQDTKLIFAEGTLEIAPTIGYADLIADLVSTGTTLNDNRLKKIGGGTIIESQACLIGNTSRLKNNPGTLSVAKQLLEFIVAHLRANENVSIFANIKGESRASIARRMFEQSVIGGLQGPTISPVFTRQQEHWYAAHLVVKKDKLAKAIAEIRKIGGSGIVVTPVTYIFEEEPQEYKNLLALTERS